MEIGRKIIESARNFRSIFRKPVSPGQDLTPSQSTETPPIVPDTPTQTEKLLETVAEDLSDNEKLAQATEKLRKRIEAAIQPEIELSLTHPELFHPSRTSTPDQTHLSSVNSTVIESSWQQVVKNHQHVRECWTKLRFTGESDSEILISFDPKPLAWKTERITIKGKTLPVTLSVRNGAVSLEQQQSYLSPDQLIELTDILTQTMTGGTHSANQERLKKNIILGKMEDSYRAQTFFEEPSQLEEKISQTLELQPIRFLTDEEAQNRVHDLMELFTYTQENQAPYVTKKGNLTTAYTVETDYDFVDPVVNPQGLVLRVNTGAETKLGLVPILDNGIRVGWTTMNLFLKNEQITKTSFELGTATPDWHLNVFKDRN